MDITEFLLSSVTTAFGVDSDCDAYYDFRDYVYRLRVNYDTKDSSVTYEARGRQVKTKLGRIVRKLWDYFADLEIEPEGGQLSSLVENMVADLAIPTIEPEIVTGPLIIDTYLSGFGSKNSCMRHEDCRPYLQLYAKNPRVVSLACVTHKNQSSRALLWRAKDFDTDKVVTYGDRVYSTHPSVHIALDKWLHYNCDCVRTHTGPPNESDIVIKNTLGKKLYVHLKVTGKHKTFPYTDSFHWMYSGKPTKPLNVFTLVNFMDCSPAGKIPPTHIGQLSSTEGMIYGYGDYSCSSCRKVSLTSPHPVISLPEPIVWGDARTMGLCEKCREECIPCRGCGNIMQKHELRSYTSKITGRSYLVCGSCFQNLTSCSCSICGRVYSLECCVGGVLPGTYCRRGYACLECWEKGKLDKPKKEPRTYLDQVFTPRTFAQTITAPINTIDWPTTTETIGWDPPITDQ